MVQLRRADMASCFNNWDLSNGMDYFRRGRVTDYVERAEEDDFTIRADVRGSRTYRVGIEWKARPIASLRCECTCPRHRAMGRCKHAAAVLFAHFFREEEPDEYPQYRVERVLRTNAEGRRLLESMRVKESVAASDEPVRLVPVLRLAENEDDATLTLKLGRRLLYVERDVFAFAERIERRERHRYGKQLEFTHALSAFEVPGQALAGYLCRQARFYAQTSSRHGTLPTALRGGLPMSGADLEEQFDLLASLGPLDDQGNMLVMADGEPEVQLRVTEKDGMIRIRTALSDGIWRVVRGLERLICFGPGVILRCAP